MYCHASATWDELSPEEIKKAIEFQTNNTSQTKVTRLERNALLGIGMDLNFLTCLLITYVLFEMYTTPTLIQSTCSYGNAITCTTRNSIICNHHVCNWDATAGRMQLSLVFYATIMDFCPLFGCVCNYGATMITFIPTFG